MFTDFATVGNKYKLMSFVILRYHAAVVCHLFCDSQEVSRTQEKRY